MVVKVVDASALAAVLFGEPEAPEVAERLAGSRLVAPALLPFEVASVCLKKMRRHPETRQQTLDAYTRWNRLEIEEMAVTFAQVIELAEETELTCYDASYLWLAVQLEAELVTLDERLGEAAETYLQSG